MIKGTVKYYVKSADSGKSTGSISLKDMFASKLPWGNAEELYAEYNEETDELKIKRL